MEVFTNIGFDWQVALANFVSFLIIFWILKKWVFGPVGDIIQQRKETIEDGVNMAQKSQEELERAQKQAEDTLREANADANSIVAKAKSHGDDLIASATAQAQEEAQKVSAKAQESIEKEKQAIERELLAKTAGLVSLGVQKILQEEVDEAKHDELTKRALSALESHTK
jgi:F-type H+-transporting ATPase subunit b